MPHELIESTHTLRDLQSVGVGGIVMTTGGVVVVGAVVVTGDALYVEGQGGGVKVGQGLHSEKQLSEAEMLA